MRWTLKGLASATSARSRPWVSTRRSRYAIVSMCIGGGMAAAGLFEAIHGRRRARAARREREAGCSGRGGALRPCASVVGGHAAPVGAHLPMWRRRLTQDGALFGDLTRPFRRRRSAGPARCDVRRWSSPPARACRRAFSASAAAGQSGQTCTISFHAPPLQTVSRPWQGAGPYRHRSPSIAHGASYAGGGSGQPVAGLAQTHSLPA